MRVPSLATAALALACAAAVSVPPAWERVALRPRADHLAYRARKPHFAVQVAQDHGAPRPEQIYRAAPVRPRFLRPISSNLEVFHPYQAETPALRALYRDPASDTVRRQVEASKARLQQYERDAGAARAHRGDYDAPPQQTEERLFPPHRPRDDELHRAEPRPSYYSPPRAQPLLLDKLNRKLKYPLAQDHIKIKPLHYEPLKKHLNGLRLRQEKNFGDERNEYPQQEKHFAEPPPEGLDIYESGKKHFDSFQHDVDDALDHYSKNYQDNSDSDLGDYKSENKEEDEESEDEFVPIKMYAQVRKTESYKHLPNEAAFEDAETPEDFINAPRLREAVKSTKAQTVYSEEGYEDKAYDHEGQQKHASNHEGHSGYLKENEKSLGRYKIPYVEQSHQAGDIQSSGKSYTHKERHAEEDSRSEEESESDVLTNKDNKKEYDLYGTGTNEQIANTQQISMPKTVLSFTTDSEKTTVHDDFNGTSIKTEVEHLAASSKRNNNNDMNKRIDKQKKIKTKSNKTSDSLQKKNFEISRIKRYVEFEVPTLSLKNTFLTESEIEKSNKEILKINAKPSQSTILDKYPYYLEKNLNNNSPLRYAENIRNVPLKTKGGMEFYDSRAKIKCSQVEPHIDPVSNKQKNASATQSYEDEVQDEEEKDEDEDEIADENVELFRKKRASETGKQSPRLRGLGVKIDCFKEKYFGENPLDSPFFAENFINNPEPLPQFHSDIFQMSKKLELHFMPSEINEILSYGVSENEKLKKGAEAPLKNFSQEKAITDLPNMNVNQTDYQVYSDIVYNIFKSIKKMPIDNTQDMIPFLLLSDKNTSENKTDNIASKNFTAYLNKENIKLHSSALRVKRSVQFRYEPYKVIKLNQDNESNKKITTSSYVSPLIKQLQASQIIDHATPSAEDIKQNNKFQPVKRNTKEKNYKTIERHIKAKEETKSEKNDFIDVNVDNRPGEPRYELSHRNHKAKYSPVANAKSLSVEEYTGKVYPELRKKDKETEQNEQEHTQKGEYEQESETPPSSEPYFDVSAYIPKVGRPIPLVESGTLNRENYNKREERQYFDDPEETKSVSFNQKSFPENDAVIVSKQTSRNIKPKLNQRSQLSESEFSEEYEDYEDEPVPSPSLPPFPPRTPAPTTTTTFSITTTTRKPRTTVVRKILNTTTIVSASPTNNTPRPYTPSHIPMPQPSKNNDYDYDAREERRLVTNTHSPVVKFLRKKSQKQQNANPYLKLKEKKGNKDSFRSNKVVHKQKHSPNVSEKTVKSEKSTVITDSESYGGDGGIDEEDVRKEQIDAMIGVNRGALDSPPGDLREFMRDYDEPHSQLPAPSSTGHPEEPSSMRQEQMQRERYEEQAPRGTQHEQRRHEHRHEKHVQHKDKPVLSLSQQQHHMKLSTPVDATDSAETEDSEEEDSRERSTQSPLRRPDARKQKKIKKPAHGGQVQSSLHAELSGDVNAMAGAAHKPHHVEVFDEKAARQSPRHGGNYRAAPAPRADPATVLSALAQAAPVLATTPRFILDPGQRKYYYVDKR